jgi:hypothetical protein
MSQLATRPGARRVRAAQSVRLGQGPGTRRLDAAAEADVGMGGACAWKGTYFSRLNTREAPVEVVTVIVGVVSAFAIVGSLLFLARQTRQSVEQFLVANELAGGRALAQGYELWDHVIDRFVDYPEMRQYFYEDVGMPEDSTTRARILAMAELIGDALQSTHWLYEGKDVVLFRTADVESDIVSDWDDWAKFILRMSPVMRSFTREHPLQYPFLTRMLNEIESATAED